MIGKMTYMEDDGAAIPVPTDIKTIKAKTNEILSLVFADTTEHRRIIDNKAVKKTLSIPSWLNVMAEKKGVNFSGALQNALKEQPGLNG